MTFLNNDKGSNVLAQESLIFQATYALYLSCYFRFSSFPKKDRFTIGQKTEAILLDLLVLVVKAYHTKNPEIKKNALYCADTKLETLKIIIRLAKDVKALDENSYLDYESRLQEIGRMLGGWIARLNKTAG